MQPVMIHHNGNKDARRFAWPNLWMQPDAQRLLSEALQQEAVSKIVASSNGKALAWDELCPTGMDEELYRNSAH